MAAKKSKKSSEPEEAPKLFYIFYNQERWENWLRTLKEADWEGDPDSEDMPEGFRILDGLSDDITLAVIKIIRLYQNERFTVEEARTKIADVEAIVMGEVADEEVSEIIASMQISMMVLFTAAQKYLEADYPEATEVKNLVKDGRKVVDDDPEKALEFASSIGSAVINGASCCGKYVKDTDDPTLFDEWLVEVERIADAMKSLKDFDEVGGEAA
ncbi:MAG TPA: DUF2150 family protein [Methanocorpusculum sp.]|mgnify:FL=1|jgi:hypothetical protein|nr:DUF2150 family protein [Methanocorpusculum sp.]MBR5815618.1 DUF2150 family protein [Methanocorpusculaceae archaeon]MBR5142639.1 DUF2150 family protein [Methanocorpusculum sp.]MBR5450716.1 DUF2150 family protein [Methanocorpusculum sp.]HJJ65177.1 DUF2150 family protein [Methanocorpusculum sp.]